jgi:hypothetical protein
MMICAAAASTSACALIWRARFSRRASASCAMARCIEFRDFDVLRLDTFDLDAPGLGQMVDRNLEQIPYPNAETMSKLLEDKGTALIKIDATARGGDAATQMIHPTTSRTDTNQQPWSSGIAKASGSTGGGDHAVWDGPR